MMKELYTAPEMELIRFTPAERLANDSASVIADQEFDYAYGNGD